MLRLKQCVESNMYNAHSFVYFIHKVSNMDLSMCESGCARLCLCVCMLVWSTSFCLMTYYVVLALNTVTVFLLFVYLPFFCSFFLHFFCRLSLQKVNRTSLLLLFYDYCHDSPAEKRRIRSF